MTYKMIFTLFAYLGAAIVLIIWGWEIWMVINWLSTDTIRVTEPIIPEIEIITKGNVTDTIYIYRQP